MQPKYTYQVVCATCYTCVIARCTSRRDADRAATSHLNAYGHDVSVQRTTIGPIDVTPRTIEQR